MKLDYSEITFALEAVRSVTIKAADAPAVGGLIQKLEKEHTRLEKLEEKKAAEITA